MTVDRRHIAALAHDGLGTFELGIVSEVFELPPEIGKGWYRFSVCSHERGPLPATGGLSLQTRSGLGALAPERRSRIKWHAGASSLRFVKEARRSSRPGPLCPRNHRGSQAFSSGPRHTSIAR